MRKLTGSIRIEKVPGEAADHPRIPTGSPGCIPEFPSEVPVHHTTLSIHYNSINMKEEPSNRKVPPSFMQIVLNCFVHRYRFYVFQYHSIDALNFVNISFSKIYITSSTILTRS